MLKVCPTCIACLARALFCVRDLSAGAPSCVGSSREHLDAKLQSVASTALSTSVVTLTMLWHGQSGLASWRKQAKHADAIVSVVAREEDSVDVVS